MTMGLAEAGLPVPATICRRVATALQPSSAHSSATASSSPSTRRRAAAWCAFAPARGPHADARAPGAARYLVQQFVESPGRDIGATVVGGRFVGAFYRVARRGEWMTTTDAGGRTRPATSRPLGIDYAERAAQPSGSTTPSSTSSSRTTTSSCTRSAPSAVSAACWKRAAIDAAAAYARHIVSVLEAAK